MGDENIEAKKLGESTKVSNVEYCLLKLNILLATNAKLVYCDSGYDYELISNPVKINM